MRYIKYFNESKSNHILDDIVDIFCDFEDYYKVIPEYIGQFSSQHPKYPNKKIIQVRIASKIDDTFKFNNDIKDCIDRLMEYLSLENITKIIFDIQMYNDRRSYKRSYKKMKELIYSREPDIYNLYIIIYQ